MRENFDFDFATQFTTVCGYKWKKATRSVVKNTIIFSYVTPKYEYFGTAACHPDDNFNEFTGSNLALARLEANILKQARDEVKEMLKGINSLYYAVNKSKHIAHTGIDTKGFAIIKHQKTRLEEQLKMLRQEIDETEHYILKFNDKIEYYKKLKGIAAAEKKMLETVAEENTKEE